MVRSREKLTKKLRNAFKILPSKVSVSGNEAEVVPHAFES